jgi:hypothetical protein
LNGLTIEQIHSPVSTQMTGNEYKAAKLKIAHRKDQRVKISMISPTSQRKTKDKK